MHARMMQTPLVITSIMRHAERCHGDREIVSLTGEDTLHRYTLSDAFRRARQLANALESLCLKESDRIATLAWNDHRHFELYYGVSCSGRVLHTINPRLFPDQIQYIANHAEDSIIFVDPIVVPVLEKIQDELTTVRHFVVLGDESDLEGIGLANAVSYESLLTKESAHYDWPEIDEHSASSLCYTSGTTGNPKGVLYSHRSTVLHAYASALPDSMGLSARDAVLPVVPMFHVNAWGTVYAGPMVGAKLILPGAKAGDPETLYGLIENEGATIALGVPTVWQGLLQHLDKQGTKLTSLERTVVGGSACPIAMMDEFRDQHDVVTHHAWGMTETSPIGAMNSPKPAIEELPAGEQDRIRSKQGRAPFGIEMRIINDAGEELPWDGEQFGALQVRGPWVAASYYGADEDPVEWFETGDVATIDAFGYMQITDRTKDVIKSGGEWISSIELENIAIAHPAVAEAAVIGIEHPKWSERPLLVLVKQADVDVSGEEVLESLRGKVADWWLPNAVEFVEELPHTATGKISKLTLRQQFRDYQFPS